MARSRPIVGEELDRVLQAVAAVRAADHQQWEDFLLGLFHSGLRISELQVLSWIPGAGHWIDEGGQYPLIRIAGASEKGHTDRFQPVTPEFWGLIRERPRRGLVFPLVNTLGKPFKTKSAVRVISAIGRRAGVVTDPARGKCATSHDIGRRALATRLASTLSPQEHAKWMRHESIDTTMKYYYQADAISLSRRIWGDRSPDARSL
jgi:integrase